MNTQEIISSIALTKLNGLSLLNARTLLDSLGSASEVFAHRKDIVGVIPDASKRLVAAFDHTDEALRLAEEEMKFVEQKRLRVLTLNDVDYPYYPDTLIVSGLAYGIDVCAHRAALDNGMSTIGVLAHGLDTIYPSMHRQIAADMVHRQGGLLTEYGVHTTPEKGNFVRRNRIVAGMCDACIVVESSERGGSLITAELAMEYNRDVFAFPGRVYDEYSRGCNNLIRRQQATLLTCAADLLDAMGWDNPLKKDSKRKVVQRELFPDLTDEERALVNTLNDVDDKHINQIAIDANIPYSRASMILFDLEMKGIVKALGGARYRIMYH